MSESERETLRIVRVEVAAVAVALCRNHGHVGLGSLTCDIGRDEAQAVIEYARLASPGPDPVADVEPLNVPGLVSAYRKGWPRPEPVAGLERLAHDVRSLQSTAVGALVVDDEAPDAAFREGQAYAYDEVLRRIAALSEPTP